MPSFTVSTDRAGDRFTDIKDPDSVEPYSINWSNWLASGDTVTDATWTVSSPSGDTTPIVVDSNSESSPTASAVLSAGTAGNNYIVTCHVTSNDGYEDDRSIYISVRQK